ncbi:MAG: peptidoglycan editing factor PgeF [Anaerolineaceae bacterium]
MGFYEKGGLRYYQFESFKSLPVFHAILTRRGGISQPPFDSLNTGGTVGDDPQAVSSNLVKIFTAFGRDLSSRFDVWQVHGDQVVCADSPRNLAAPYQRADGILTENTNITLFMRFADCVPILLVDPLARAIGIVHAGWQGTYRRVAQRAVEKMSACYGSRPESLWAGVGPSICQSCYEVGPDVLRLFQANFGADGQRFFQQEDGQLHLDLWKANQEILFQAGVQQVEVSRICTACHAEDWYSHRGEKGKTGRFAVIMGIKDH